MNTRFKLFLLLLLFSSCSGLNKLSLYNLSGQYDNTLFTEIPSTYFNLSEDQARVYVPILMNDLIVGHDDVQSKEYRKALISYQLFENYEAKQILASDSLLIVDSTLLMTDTILEVDIQYPGRKKYILKLELTDLNRVDVVRQFLVLDNTEPSSRGDYLLKNDLGEILFSNILSGNERFKLQMAESAANKVFVRYYKRDFPLALPPFLEETETNFDYNADSIFTISGADGLTEEMTLDETGFYHFQTDTNSRGARRQGRDVQEA